MNIALCDGIHGHSLDRQQYIQQGWLAPTSVLSRGQIGCWESHKALWVKLLTDLTTPFIFIAEDDTCVVNYTKTRKNITSVFTWLQRHQPKQWDILFISRSPRKRFTKKMLSKKIGIPGRVLGFECVYCKSSRCGKTSRQHTKQMFRFTS